MRRWIYGTIATILAVLLPHLAFGQTSGDPLTDQINLVRLGYGLSALVSDGTLSSLAYDNNAHQQARGMGHHVFTSVGQCVGWNQPTCEAVVRAWLSSPAHAGIILMPGITACGGHFDGQFWTLNVGHQNTAGMGQAATPPAPGLGFKLPAGSTQGGCPVPSLILLPHQRHLVRRCGIHPLRWIGRLLCGRCM